MTEMDEQRNKEILRTDGRRPLELRRIRIRLGVKGYEDADGSAYIEQGKTRVLAIVCGPHQPKNNVQRINCSYYKSTFAFGAAERKRLPQGGGRQSQERILELRRAMESIIEPNVIVNSQVDIYVQILQVDGSEFCVAINAATLALIDAGIPIKDYAIGCSVTLTPSEESLSKSEQENQGVGFLDANYIEECSRGATLNIVALPGLMSDISEVNPIVIAQGSGQRLHISQLEPMKMRAINGCKDIRAILDGVVRRHLLTYSVHSTIE